MTRRALPPSNPRETIFGPAPTTAEEAFLRFGNACHWEAELGPAHGSSRAFVEAALARMPRAQHRLVADCIAALTSGARTFAEVGAVWKRSENTNMILRWDDPEDCLRFLLLVRDLIDPQAWPASRPQFRPNAAGQGARPAKR